MRSIVVTAAQVDALARITLMGELGRARDALRREGAGRAWFVEDAGEFRMDGSGPLLALSAHCLPQGDDREAAARLLDRIIETPWTGIGEEDRIASDIAAEQADIADVLRTLGYGLEAKLGVVLPSPVTEGHAIVGKSRNHRADAVVAHLARRSPYRFMIEVRDDHRIRIAPSGARIHLPSPVRNPVEAMRLLATVPQEILR